MDVREEVFSTTGASAVASNCSINNAVSMALRTCDDIEDVPVTSLFPTDSVSVFGDRNDCDDGRKFG